MSDHETGTELGHYRIIRLLGEGGMGQVYLARDTKLEREVAIKVLSVTGTDQEDTRRRLLREAQAAAALDHPNICAVYEVGETPDGRTFIVMQYVQGETLATLLHNGPMPVRQALSLCGGIAEALAAAHKRGVIHRDLKPQNIIVTTAGQPKLLDFGLAKSMPLAAIEPDIPTKSIKTFEGIIKGTPAYMAPEQVQQRTVDGRTDLFALGATLFECLTCRRAFAGENVPEIFGQILHVNPPAVSSLRPELSERHDELCRRLLAKDPADRFQSAEELVGALRLLTFESTQQETSPYSGPSDVKEEKAPTTGGSTTGSSSSEFVRRGRRFWQAVAVTAIFCTFLMVGWVIWNSLRTLPPVPAEAEGWYQRGAAAMRDGAYYSGQLALREALRLFPNYPLAHARLAEALAELDDERGAQAELLRVTSTLPDQSRLPADDRIRIEGTRSLVLRDLDTSVAAYRRLVGRRSKDVTAWLDLGRALEAAGKLAEAGKSYTRAIEIDPQYAAARMRLGSVEAQQSSRREALADFAEAERLHHAAANTEGEAEVLLRRGRFNDAIGDSMAARADIERALSLVVPLKGTYQIVRAKLGLSGVTASQGHFAESEQMAEEAVQQALQAGMETIAAEGLVGLAGALLQSRRLPEAGAKAQRAIELAQRREARRTMAMAQVQLASIRLEEGKLEEALALSEQALVFLKQNKYRRLELDGLSVMSRVYQQRDDLDRARSISSEVVATAEALDNDALVCRALSSLASVTSELGQFPQALSLRQRVESIRRKQNDASALPYDLANRAEILISLGRAEEASAALNELDAGIKAGVDAYVGRTRRVAMLRGYAAVTALRSEEAVRHLRMFQPSGGADQTAELARIFLRYARARLGQRPAPGQKSAPVSGSLSPEVVRELQFWTASAALLEGNPMEARSEAERGLALLGDMSNEELRWRLAAVCALACKSLGETGQMRDTAGRAGQALTRLRTSWPSGIETYEKRPDLAELMLRLRSLLSGKGE